MCCCEFVIVGIIFAMVSSRDVYRRWLCTTGSDTGFQFRYRVRRPVSHQPQQHHVFPVARSPDDDVIIDDVIIVEVP